MCTGAVKHQPNLPVVSYVFDDDDGDGDDDVSGAPSTCKRPSLSILVSMRFRDIIETHQREKKVLVGII